MPSNSNLLSRLLTFTGILLSIGTFAAFFDEASPRLQMLTQLRVQFALAFLMVIVPLCFLRWRFALFFAIPFLINCAHFLPLYFSPVPQYHAPSNVPIDVASRAIAQHAGEAFSITHINIDRDRVVILDKLNEQGSDIVFIQEVQPPVADALAERMPDYEAVLVEARWDTRGSAMLVRRDWDGELISAEYQLITTYGDRPLAHTVINLNGQELSLLSLHVTRPTNPLQAVEFADVAQWSATQQAAGRAVFIIGDFNQTPWGSRFQTLLTDGKLINGQRGFGLQTTWPANLPALLRIPIDHTVHSDKVILFEREVGGDWGGDHRPIHVKIALP